MKQDPTPREQPKPKPKVIAAIPSFNEDRCIGSVVLKAKRFVDVVVVIDDGSTDGTSEVAKAAGALVIRHENNLGKGAAVNIAFKTAREMGCKALVLLDGDGQHNPAYIPSLLKPVLNDEADMVVGSRFLNSTSQMPVYRKLGQRLLTFVTNVGSRTKLSDSQSGFRAFSSKGVEAISLSEQGLSVESEMQFAARQHRLRVTEVPIEVAYFEKPRRHPLGHGVSVLGRVLVLFSLRQPLLLFGLPGLVFLGVGLALGANVMTIYGNTKELAVGNALITVLLCLAGLLALFTALMLQAVKELMRGTATQSSKEVKAYTSDNNSSAERQ